MNDDITSLPNATLLMEARLLELKIIHNASSAIETERYCLIQLELGGRAARELVLDPRD
ncbi:MAG: hypothetical protein WC972_08020 [Trueperaceae bacterium]|jgi:hypothetical protein|nr:hypothetical protein [Truepera sp.]HRN18961.1 hypothetical protein [Trueperaceae bacterium]HRQ10588.1 hypothetical protein [Trueperaceae bacterium]